MTLHKSDYKKLANAINLTFNDNNNFIYRDIFDNLIMRIGIELKADNPRFSLTKFSEACYKKI